MEANLYNCDNLEFMANKPDNYYELAIVDPEYGINVNHNMGRRKGDFKSDYKPAVWDKEQAPMEYFSGLFRISKHQIIWGANHFIELINKNSSCWIVWDKLFSNEVSFASCELAWTSFDSVVKKFTYSSARKNGIHPTQKPIKLYEWLLENYAKKGDKILDTHGGSMSSVIACINMEFDIDCCELDKDYFRDATNRVQAHANQMDMFREQPIINIQRS